MALFNQKVMRDASIHNSNIEISIYFLQLAGRYSNSPYFLSFRYKVGRLIPSVTAI
jgi:hypothetical protein